MQSHLQEFLKSIPVGGVPATGPGQQTEQWARIRGGVLSPHTKPHTIKRIQEVATKKRICPEHAGCPATGTARHTLNIQTRPRPCSHLQPEGHRTALSPCISRMILTGEIVWLFYELPGGCERGGESSLLSLV